MVPWVGVAARLPAAAPASSSGGAAQATEEELELALPISTSLPRPLGSPRKAGAGAGGSLADSQALAPSSGVTGRAFCFLPLPALTGLPVHLNAYFELSSNRRDVW
jgi:sacsin